MFSKQVILSSPRDRHSIFSTPILVPSLKKNKGHVSGIIKQKSIEATLSPFVIYDLR